MNGDDEFIRQEDGYLAITGDVLLNGTIGGPNWTLNVTQAGPRPPGVHIKPTRIILMKVDDIHNTALPPPVSHNGSALSDPKNPLEVARLGRGYLANALVEAAKLPEGV